MVRSTKKAKAVGAAVSRLAHRAMLQEGWDALPKREQVLLAVALTDNLVRAQAGRGEDWNVLEQVLGEMWYG